MQNDRTDRTAGQQPKQKRFPNKTALLLCAIVVLALASLGLALYPTISESINSRSLSKAVSRWEKQAEQRDPHRIDDLLGDAQAYNEQLGEQMFPFEPDEQLHEQYEQALCLEQAPDAGHGSAMMASLHIPAISLDLPIYHGTDDLTLRKGLGHVEGSFLPLGNNREHALISGHSGLSNASMFDCLDQLKEGDRFSIVIPGRILDYRISTIRTVLPEEYRSLEHDPDHALATLVTCTPYGINTHRLLVTGVLRDIRNLSEDEPAAKQPAAAAGTPSSADQLAWSVLVVSACSALIALALVVHAAVHRRKQTKPSDSDRNSEDSK